MSYDGLIAKFGERAHCCRIDITVLPPHRVPVLLAHSQKFARLFCDHLVTGHWSDHAPRQGRQARRVPPHHRGKSDFLLELHAPRCAFATVGWLCLMPIFRDTCPPFCGGGVVAPCGRVVDDHHPVCRSRDAALPVEHASRVFEGNVVCESSFRLVAEQEIVRIATSLLPVVRAPR